MQNRFKLLFLVLVSLVLMGQPCLAQEAKSMAAGLRATYVMLQDDKIDVMGNAYDNSYDPALAFSADFTYFFSKTVSLEASIGYMASDMDFEASGTSVGYGTLIQVPLLLTVRYHMPVSGKIAPYVGGGIGYYLNDIDGGEFFDYFPGSEPCIDDTLGIHLNAGLELAIRPHLALNLDLKYILSNTDIGYDPGSFEVSSNSSLNALSAGLGIKYYF